MENPSNTEPGINLGNGNQLESSLYQFWKNGLQTGRSVFGEAQSSRWENPAPTLTDISIGSSIF